MICLIVSHLISILSITVYEKGERRRQGEKMSRKNDQTRGEIPERVRIDPGRSRTAWIASGEEMYRVRIRTRQDAP